MAVSLNLEPRLPFSTTELRGIAPGLRNLVVQVPTRFGAGHTVGSRRDWRPRLPRDWYQYTHPEGCNYFFHPSKRILTPVDPRVRRNLDRLLLAFTDIEPKLPGNAQGGNFHIVLGFTEEQFERQIVQYYLVDYDFRIVFWVHPVDVRGLGLQPYTSLACLRSMLLADFWTHVNLFPATARLDVEIAIGNLAHALDRGRVPALHHLTPWARDECTLYLEALNGALTGPPSYKVAILGRLNTILCKHRHSLWWDYNGNPIPFLIGRVNDPFAPVPQRVPVLERAQLSSVASLLASFLLLSACVVFDGMSILLDGSADRAAFTLTLISSLLLYPLTPAMQLLDHRLPDVLAGRPWLELGLVLLGSLDLGLYALLFDSAVRLILSSNGGQGLNGVVQAVLKVVLLPLLTIVMFALAGGNRNIHLPPR